MKGSQESLTTAVVKDAANWATPNACDGNTGSTTTQGRSLVADMQLHGQADPASSNTSGSRQGLWATPRSGMSAGSKDAEWQPGKKPTVNGQAITTSLTDQVRIAQLWPTITAHTPDMESNGPKGNSGTYLAGAVKGWLTPKVPSGGGQATRTTDGGGLRKLEDQTEARANGKLNPRWVETLMGLPIGWTMPSCTSPQTIEPTSCGSSATELCRPPQSELLELFCQS